MALLDEMRRPRTSGTTFPGVVRPNVASQPRSLWDSIRERIGDLAGGVGGVVRKAGENLMPVPAGMEGMLSPEQISQARRSGLLAMGGAMLESSGAPAGGGFTPTFGQALGRGVGAAQGAYGQGIETAIGTAEAMKGMKEKDRIAQFRSGLAQKYPITPDMDPAALHKALMGMYSEAVSVGDLEFASKTAQVVSAMANTPAGTPEGLMEISDVIDPVTGKASNVVIGNRGGKRVAGFETAPKPSSEAEMNASEAAAWKRSFDAQNGLQNDFARQTRDHQTVANAANAFNAIAPAARQLNGPAQISLVFQFMKIQDPGSTVREGEYATAANAGSVPERIRNAYNKAILEGGPFLNEAQVDSFAARVKEMSDSWQKEFDRVAENFRGRASDAQLRPDRIVIDYFDTLRNPKTASKGGGGSEPPVKK